MRIALLGNNYPPEFRGGTERVMQALARELRDLAEEVVVICGSEAGLPDQDQEVIQDSDDGIPVFRIPLRDDETYDLSVPRPRVQEHVRRLLQEHRVELLHLHHWSHLSDGLLQMAKAAGVAGLCTLHDMWTSCARFFRQPPTGSGITCPTGAGREPCVQCIALDHRGGAGVIRGQLLRRDMNLGRELGAAMKVTAPSASCAVATRRHAAFVGPIQVIPHGLLQKVDQARQQETRPRSPFRVGTFGNLGPEKGVSDLLVAMVGVSGAELFVFGHSPDAEYPATLQNQAQKLGVTLHVHGPYGDGSGAAHPADQLDLAVFFSRCEETYGLVVEEALARGTPVLVSDRGALPARVRAGGGLAVQHRDVAALHDNIQALVTNPDVYRRLRGEIPETFPTMRDAACCYRALYQEALARL